MHAFSGVLSVCVFPPLSSDPSADGGVCACVCVSAVPVPAHPAQRALLSLLAVPGQQSQPGAPAVTAQSSAENLQSAIQGKSLPVKWVDGRCSQKK